MNERSWIPVNPGLIAKPNLITELATVHGDLIHVRRELKRWRLHLATFDASSADRAARQHAWSKVNDAANQERTLGQRQTWLLQAMTLHTLDWTHMSSDCAICMGEVKL